MWVVGTTGVIHMPIFQQNEIKDDLQTSYLQKHTAFCSFKFQLSDSTDPSINEDIFNFAVALDVGIVKKENVSSPQ